MKITKILALILACFMVVCMFAACDSGDAQGDDATTTPADGENADVTIKVSIKVKDLDGKVVYDVPEYTYVGEAPNLIELIDDYLYMEHYTEVGFDDNDNLQTIGTVEAGEVTSHNDETDEDVVEYTTYWWYTLNGKDGSQLMEEYIVQNGDVIEYYLAKNTSH